MIRPRLPTTAPPTVKKTAPVKNTSTTTDSSSARGNCVLDTATFNSLGSEATRYSGWTSHASHEVLLFAQSNIEETGDYDLIDNNCQDFAISLLFRLADSVHEPDRMLEKLDKAVLKLVKTRVDKATGDIRVYDRNDVLLNVVIGSAHTGRSVMGIIRL